ncbi:MAG TPA: thioesterase family protein [Acidimicrobiia bacterium]|nr:thioesterase family protein [Acidimicrobiia bacterium]
MSNALFIKDGDVFHPTGLTRSFWSNEAQHGGPPVGLLGRAIENVPTVIPMQVVRLTVDLFREVPVDHPLTIETDVVRDGRRIQVVDAVILAAGRKVARATGLKIRTTDVAVPSMNARWHLPPGPEEAEAIAWGRFGFHQTDHERFHSHSIEIRTIDDSFLSLGEGLSWVRLTVPLVAGEETTPFVRTATLSDVGNGNSMALDGRQWLYVNPDVNLSLHRCPEGEWLGMRSLAHQHRTGIGYADSELFDETGPVGRVGQSQILEPRGDSRTT